MVSFQPSSTAWFYNRPQRTENNPKTEHVLLPARDENGELRGTAKYLRYAREQGWLHKTSTQPKSAPVNAAERAIAIFEHTLEEAGVIDSLQHLIKSYGVEDDLRSTQIRSILASRFAIEGTKNEALQAALQHPKMQSLLSKTEVLDISTSYHQSKIPINGRRVHERQVIVDHVVEKVKNVREIVFGAYAPGNIQGLLRHALEKHIPNEIASFRLPSNLRITFLLNNLFSAAFNREKVCADFQPHLATLSKAIPVIEVFGSTSLNEWSQKSHFTQVVKIQKYVDLIVTRGNSGPFSRLHCRIFYTRS